MSDKHPREQTCGTNEVSGSHLIGVDNYPLAYFNMPKAACTTIKNILFHIQHGRWHENPLSIHKDIKENAVLLRKLAFGRNRASKYAETPFTTFTFVRNPGLRVYSAFVEKIWAGGPYAFPQFRRYLRKNHGYRLPVLGEEGSPAEYDARDVSVAFKQFLKFVESNVSGNTPFPPNPHWTSQYKRVKQLPPRDILNHIGRVETFAKDMEMILERVGWQDTSIATMRFNEGPRAPWELSAVMDEEISAMLWDIYQLDYIAFGYVPPVA